MRASAHQQDLLFWLAPEMSFVDEPLRCGLTERLSDHRGTLSRWNHDDLPSHGRGRSLRSASCLYQQRNHSERLGGRCQRGTTASTYGYWSIILSLLRDRAYNYRPQSRIICSDFAPGDASSREDDGHARLSHRQQPPTLG